MCQRGGIRLHKFISNRKEVIESIPIEVRTKDIKDLDVEHEDLPLERALGIEWCIKSDSFQFRIILKDKPFTKQGILSTVSLIYDPLGFAAPFLLKGKRILQELADHPEDRLEPSPPFSYCGVNSFGPWNVKEDHKELKRYGVLFTCMASRAVHLEVYHTMETDSFLNALRQFVCRRGPIHQLRADQGSNFIGARQELQEALTKMDQGKIKTELLKRNCDWIEFNFNAPAASHMGEVWERQIKTV